tara:strand:+ start:397 stop:942 length:546 start_codon:yes stop_codon:yes gene_type:complete
MSLLSTEISLKRKTFYVFLISLIIAVFMYAYFYDLGYFPFNLNYWIYVLNPISISYAPFRTLIVYGFPIAISYLYYKNVNNALQKNDAGKLDKLGNDKKLSEKYDVLVSFTGLAYVMMIVSTGFFIYMIIQFVDAPKTAKESLENAMITSTVSYVITMFSLFCLTKIINFLFDLDKHKSDK